MIIAAALLVALGIAVIYTSSPSLATAQFMAAIIGFVAFLLVRNFDYRALKSLIKISYIFILISLIITFILGIEARGSVRWIPIGPFNFQPSEFAKPVIIMALASFWSTRIPTWFNIGKSLLIVLPIALIVFRQPDLGTALTILFIWIVMLFAANIDLIKIFILSAISGVIIPLSWFFLHDYQKQRIYSFLSPTSDPKGEGFHVIQSMIAVGSGQIWGRGIGRGTQSRLQFLPEFRTDFIFAFISEELGFIGSTLVLVLYSIIFILFFKLLSKVNDRFGELIIIGVMAMLIFQITVNIGMNIGILPITGITLPLLSYGGSSVLTIFLSFGLIYSVMKYGVSKKKFSALNFGTYE